MKHVPGDFVRSRKYGQRGSALLTVLILSTVMCTVLAGLITYVSQSAKLERRSSLRTEALYAGEYAAEQAYSALYTLVSQDSTALPDIAETTTATNLSTAPTDVFPASEGYAWKAFLTVPLENNEVVARHSGFNPAKGSYKFLSVVEFERTVPTMAEPVAVQLQREWSYVLTPLFQYAIFYDKDMELFPGARFVVGGRVHSNGRIYTGTSASITFTDYVSNVDGLANEYHPLDPRAPGSPGSNISYNKGEPISTTREDPPGAINQDTSDGNNNNDGPRELIEIPDYLHSDANAETRGYNKAGLKILRTGTGHDFLTADGTRIPSADPLAGVLQLLVSTGTMVDFRESATIPTTDVDITRVTAAYSAGGLPRNIPNSNRWPNNSSVPAALKNQPIPEELRGKSFWNGILYVADSGTSRAGVKLLNGSRLPDGTQSDSPQAGLTIISQNPVYVVGDYNTGGSPPVNSGTDLSAANAVAGYTVQPAAIMADAVTVVSANWVSGNYNAVSNYNARDASNTTINAALISGIVASNGSAYSGGVENYIRLQEDWSGKRLTYYGSIINLYESRQATAPWQNTGIYYNAPARNWHFDVNFLDPDKLPPGSPILRSLKRGQWAQLR